jgi:hypothetical protein
VTALTANSPAQAENKEHKGLFSWLFGWL